MTIIFYLIFGGFVAFLGYNLAVAVFNAVKIQLKRADDLERQFGKDVIGAAKFTFLGKKMKFLEYMLAMRDGVFGQIFILSMLGYAGYRWAGRAKWIITLGSLIWAILFIISLVNLITDGND